MRFKRLEVTEPSGHKLEFLEDIDTGKLYKRTGLVPRDLKIRGCQIIESYVSDIDAGNIESEGEDSVPVSG